MKVLITGGTGLLGKALIETSGLNYEIIATYFGNYSIADSGNVKYSNLDVRDKKRYEKLFSIFNPEVVIHTAGIGSPDFAEKNKKETWNVNVEGTKNIVYLCNEFGSRFIYVSSNGIYEGNDAPYAEEDMARPINYYGKVKLEGENVAKSAEVPLTIIRPILMYGWNYPFERPNIISGSLKKLREKETIGAYDDVFYNPVSAEFCAEAIWRIVGMGICDIFNIGGKDIVSVYDFVKIAARVFGLDASLIMPIHQGSLKDLVERPKNTSYTIEKMERILKISPMSVKEGLEIMKAMENKLYGSTGNFRCHPNL